MEYSCNSKGTNKFETLVGMLNMAPIKISGQYKLVYDKNLKPWLDDYTGRRVALDTSISFLQQVANFLSVKTFISDNICLRFGGFQRNTITSWHIPIYFGSQLKQEDYPKYFVVSQIPNETFKKGDGIIIKDTIDNIYKFGLLLKVVNLEHIGLYDILNEIQSEPYFNYPIYFNHQEQKVQIFGFGIEQQYPCQYTLNLTKYYSNQAYLDVVNNKILNSFADNNIIFPRFLNIEFEFDVDIQTEQSFNNFYGYFSNSKVIDIDKDKYGIPVKEKILAANEKGELIIDENKQPVILISDIHNGYFIKSRLNQYVYNHENQISDYILDGVYNIDGTINKDKLSLQKYLVEINNGSVNEINERPPQVRFKLTHLNIGDYIEIFNDGDLILSYQIELNDIQPFDTLYSTMLYLCRKLTVQTNYDYEFSCEQSNNGSVIVKVVSNIDYDELFEIYNIKSSIKLPIHAQVVDTDFEFRGIGQNDVWLCGNQNLLINQEYLTINNITYKIIETFWFENYLIVRLVDIKEINLWESKQFDEITPVQISKLTTAFIYEEHDETIVKLEPINFLTYYPEIESNSLGNYEKYISKLKDTFLKTKTILEENENGSITEKIEILPDEEQNQDFIKAIKDFTNNIEISNNYKNNLITQFVNQDNGKLKDYDKLIIEKHNESIVKNILFNSMGYTGFMTPNILNIDKQEWIQNGCVDIEKGIYDLFRFSWFLIAGTSIEENDWRYFDYKKSHKPKITSRLIKITDSLCETIFLGVKYQLPIAYENWEFAVYLNFNDPDYLNDPKYFVETYPEEKLILLSINKYLDFTDLIRGGDIRNEPLLDLSFFNNIKTSYNNSSEYFVEFTDTVNDNKLILEPFYDDKSKKILFNNGIKTEVVSDWIQTKNNTKYFCLQSSNKSSLKNKFDATDTEKTIYITATITYNGEKYTYQSMRLTFKGIEQIHDTYLWFKDLEVAFFDTTDVYLHKYNQQTQTDEVIKVKFDNQEKTNIVTYDYLKDVDKSSPYYDYRKIVTIVEDAREQKFELILPQNINSKGERVSNTISLLNDWFRVNKIITEKEDGSKVTTIDVKTYSKNKNYPEYLNNLKNELLFDTSTYVSEYNLFTKNQIWKIVQDMLLNCVKFKEYSEKQMYQELSRFSVEHFLNLPNKSIPIKNSNYSEFSDNYVVINAYSIDKNYVIWNIENDSKIVKINRYNSCYLPLLPIESNIEKFQILNYQVNNSLFNLYDEAFGGYFDTVINDVKVTLPISGTTLWEEVQGNLISTLFTQNDVIELTTAYPLDNSKSINYFELLKKVIDYNKVIVTDDNHEYIDTLNKNVKPYIIETYALMLLKNFYTLDSVTSNDGLRIPYTIDNQNSYSIYVPHKLSFGVKYQNLQNIVFKLIRK